MGDFEEWGKVRDRRGGNLGICIPRRYCGRAASIGAGFEVVCVQFEPVARFFCFVAPWEISKWTFRSRIGPRGCFPLLLVWSSGFSSLSLLHIPYIVEKSDKTYLSHSGSQFTVKIFDCSSTR